MKISKEGSLLLGQDLNKPLRPEEYPSQEEIDSLTGEIDVSRMETALRTFVRVSPVLSVPLLGAAACGEVEIPETPAVVRTPEEVGLPPTPTLEIKPTYTPISEPGPAETEEPAVSPTSEPATPTSEQATPTPEPATPIPEPVEECVVESCEPYQEIALYHDLSDEQSFSKLVPGTNKNFLVKDRQGGRMLIEVTEPSGAKWEAWADDNPGAYGPVGEVPPAAVCTEPYWSRRTPDRKKGNVIRGGNERQEIYPEGNPTPPHYVWMNLPHDFSFILWRRDGKIIEIDRNNQIITFDLGGGLIVKREFNSELQVVMRIHNTSIGTPSSEIWQTGGNPCDLQEGDAAGILALSEGEVASPSPEGHLWGVYIVE